MDIQTRKIEFIQQFLKLQSEEVISQFELLLKKKISSERNFASMTVEELNSRIDQSEDDFKSGRFKTTAQLKSKYS